MFGMRKMSKGLNCATVSRNDNARRTMKSIVFQGSNLKNDSKNELLININKLRLLIILIHINHTEINLLNQNIKNNLKLEINHHESSTNYNLD